MGSDTWYTVGQVSKLVGLTTQTIREYEQQGLLTGRREPQNQYRLFDADAVNKAAAIRRLRNMGLSLSEIKQVYTEITADAYRDMIKREIRRQERELAHKKLILQLLNEHATASGVAMSQLNHCSILEQVSYYCLDYRRGDTLLLHGAADKSLLNAWMERSFFTRNYSPYPAALLAGGGTDTLTIGFAIKAPFLEIIGLDTAPPVFLRSIPRCIHTMVRHTFDLRLLPDGPAFILEFMRQNGLTVAAEEPFLVGEVSYHQGGEKMFFSHLYIPVS